MFTAAFLLDFNLGLANAILVVAMQIPGYRIIRKINQGGMSTVYLAVQISVGREVALKVMSPVFNADPIFSQRFQREANIVGQLSHPNIVSIYDIGCYKNLNYIAMDYLPGGSVHDRMREGLSTLEVLRITREVARALNIAHEKGYVHRDIKPDNILFREDGTTVLSDFGVAKIVNGSKVTNAGTIVGTPHYMSPEQSRGIPLDGRSDIYSLGIVFYEMLTGVVPYQADEPVAIAIKHLTAPIPTLPGQHAIFQSMVKKLLAKSAKDRFQSGAEIIDAIDGIEHTLAGYPNRRTPFTDASEMNVMTLLRALIITSYAALRFRFLDLTTNMSSWRWTPNRGFYLHPKATVTQIRTQVDSFEDRRDTVISTRIQKAARYEEIAARRLGMVTRTFMLLFVLSVIWSAISVGLTRYKVPGEKFLPDFLSGFIVSTAGVVEGYADKLIGRNSSAPGTASDPQALSIVDNGIHQPAETQSQSLINVNRNQENLTNEKFSSTTGQLEAKDTKAQLQSGREPPKFALTIVTEPNDARVRILNIRERYRPGIPLKAGRYSIEISKPGFQTTREWQRIKGQDLTLRYKLTPSYQDSDVIVDSLKDGSKGPEMIVIPTGTFTMGKQGVVNAAPIRSVTIATNIAIGKYEITFAQYQKYTDTESINLPPDNKWGRGSRPVMNISWQDTVDFALWLSDQTGKTYRLPTEAEWEFAARAATDSDYWWGNDNPGANANCKRGCKSEYAKLLSSKSAPVGSFPENPYLLHDTSGNVAEWVADCYLNHYSGAPIDGRAIQQDNCKQRVIRGGAMNDNFRALYNYARQGKDATEKNNTIGFRLVRELEK